MEASYYFIHSWRKTIKYVHHFNYKKISTEKAPPPALKYTLKMQLARA